MRSEVEQRQQIERHRELMRQRKRERDRIRRRQETVSPFLPTHWKLTAADFVRRLNCEEK